MELTPKERLGRGLDLLAVGLRPFVELHMRASVAGRDWVALLQARDEQRDGRPRTYSIDDPHFILRILTEEWRAFGTDLTRSMRSLAEELRETRNQWAHSVSVAEDDAARALDTMERLLTAVGAAGAARDVRTLRLVAPGTDETPGTEEQGPQVERRDEGSAAPGATEPSRRVAPVPVPRHEVEPGTTRLPRHRPRLGAGHARVTIESGPLDVDLVFQDAVNYALVHNGISPLRALTVSNLGDAPIHVASLTVTLESPFEESLAEPLTLRDITIGPGDSLDAPTGALALRPHPGPFVRMAEAVTGEVNLVATTPNGRYRADHPVRLLARDEWWAASGIPESLAAFVSPRDPAVVDLLAEASTLLEQRTGDPSLPGYQAGAERVLAMTEAVFDTMQARQIRYVEPLASFEGTGQKIRPPREVLVERWGTCLDLTCAFAATLEAAGLKRVVVLCDGHAFPGVLVEEVQLEDVALRDPNMLTNLADSGLLVTVETTALTARETRVTFAEARAATRRWFAADLDRVDHALDIRSAHRRVRPLPVVRGDGADVVVEVERIAEEPVPLPRQAAPPSSVAAGDRGDAARAVPPRVEQWRNALLDLSFRNPLLNMRTGRSGLDLHVPTGSLGALEDMLAAGTPITLVPHDRLDAIHREAGARTAQDIDAAQRHLLLTQERSLFAACATGVYDARLRGLARRARTVVEETGANNLYVALGTLRWTDNNREAVAPLFLVPVTIKERRGRPYEVEIEEGTTAVPNQCLIEKLRVSKGLEIPYFQQPDLDSSGIDLPGTLQEIRAALIRAGLPYGVEETAHLAIFQFSTLQLWQDLSDHWPAFLDNPVVRHLVETPTSSFDDGVPQPPPDPTAEAACYLPVPVDGSQLEAVRWAAAGRSFVLEGPPGTGKSQTITNLIAHNLAEGGRVLFVAEKQAALDVVKRRLDAVGLGFLSLDLHGRNQTPAAVREQLRTALHAQTGGNPATWEALQATYRTLVAQLQHYPGALHDAGPAGLSAWTAREVVLALSRGTDAAAPADGLRVPEEVVGPGIDTDAVYDTARGVAEAVSRLSGAVTTQAWGLAGPLDPHTLGREALAGGFAALTGAQRAATDPDERALADLAESPEHLELIASWLDAAHEGVAMPLPAAHALVGPAWDDEAEEAGAALARHRAEHAPVLQTFSPSVLDADLDTLLAEARAADSRFLKDRPRRRVLERLAPVLRPGATVPPKALTSVLQQLHSVRRSSRDLSRRLRAVPGMDVRPEANPLDDDAESRYATALAGVRTSAALAAALPAAASAAQALLDGGSGVGDAATAANPAPTDGALPSRLSGFGPQPSTSGPGSPNQDGVGPGGARVRALAEAWRAWFRLLESRPDGQEPRERPGRRARRRAVLAGLLARPAHGQSAAQLRSAQPRRRGTAAQRRYHARDASGRALLLVRAGGHRAGAHVVGGTGPSPRLPDARRPRDGTGQDPGPGRRHGAAPRGRG